ncbi:DUF2621 family protein [Salinithrix halophila]|uniref:DUF2621 family protein n=1 Tax=Salinithrix halophila TaxID=1485204 RepID=A0ABV8JB44_9BACL
MEWTTPARDLLNELISPVPVLERPAVKQQLKKKVEADTDDSTVKQITPGHVARGYLAFADGESRERAIRWLRKQGISLDR